jgi:hypothetical protein
LDTRHRLLVLLNGQTNCILYTWQFSECLFAIPLVQTQKTEKEVFNFFNKKVKNKKKKRKSFFKQNSSPKENISKKSAWFQISDQTTDAGHF